MPHPNPTAIARPAAADKRGRRAASWLTIALALVAGGLSARAQETPQRLPPPELSAEPLPAPRFLPPSNDPNSPDWLRGPTTNLVPPEEWRRDADGAIILPDGVTLPDSAPGPVLPDELPWAVPQKISSHKNGFFQKLSLSGAWLGTGNDPGDLGLTEIETFLTVAVPMPIREWPMLITPGYNMRLLDAPGADLPPRLHDAYVDFMWLPTFVHRWTLMLSAAPSYYSDFEASNADAFRMTGKGLVIFDYSPDRLQLIAGVLYLNRDDVKILPAGGAIWTPTDYFRFELLFPKPKLGVRFNVGAGYEDWAYLLAEFGGNTWAIQRAGGLGDKVTLADYRLMFGVERKLNGGAGYRLEGGYVFGRRVEYLSGVGDFTPPSTFIVRGGVTF